MHALLADLLVDVAGWGRVELYLSNGMADVDCSLDQAGSEAYGADVCHLGAGLQDVWLSERGVARVELLEPAEDADEAVGLNWFNRCGQRIGGLLLPSHDGREQALLWLRQHDRPRADAWRRRLATAPVPVMFAPLPDILSVTPLACGAAAEAWAIAALLQADHAASLRLDLGGAGASARFSGPLRVLHRDAATVRVGGPHCQLQLQTRLASAAARVVDRDRVSGLLLTDDAGSSLLLHPQGVGAEIWFDRVAARVATAAPVMGAAAAGS